MVRELKGDCKCSSGRDQAGTSIAVRVTAITLISSCWPKLCAAAATSRRGQPALQQLLQAFKAEELVLFVHSFHDAIGSQHQAIVFLQLEMRDGEAALSITPSGSAPSIATGLPLR